MFNFLQMAYNYEDRKVDRYEGAGFFVSTAKVNDSDNPYETGISHPSYNYGSVIIVEEYADIETAKERHKHWVEVFTSDELPESIEDVSNCKSMQMAKTFGAPTTIHKRKENGEVQK